MFVRSPLGTLASVALMLGLGVVSSAAVAADAPATIVYEYAQPAELAAQVTIYRDQYGAPHVTGPTDESVVFGFAYCQAEDFFWQIEDSYVMGLGRYAELYGKKELNKDIRNRAFEVPQRSKADYAQLEPELRSIIEAFVAGLNFYLDHHPETKPRLLTRFEPWHVIAHNRGVALEMGYGHAGAPSDQFPSDFGPQAKAATVSPPPSDFAAEVRAAIGSNEWAIGPSRTRNKTAMLYINPHQPYYGFGQFYEAHLKSGEGWNFSGATFYGNPMLTLGHNEYLGWALTVNSPHTSNTWRVTFDDPSRPLHYRHGDGYREAVEWTDTIRWKRGSKFEEQQFTFRKTHFGPLVKRENERDYLTVRMGKFYESLLVRQSLKMVRSRNLAEFREAMRLLDLPIFNVAYADVEGNIFYAYNGVVPRRPGGHNWEQVLNGSDPGAEWQGYHSFDELPQLLNPPCGYIQNCNSTPYTTTDDHNPAIGDYPDYMVRDKHDDKRRAKVSRMLLREMKDVTFDDWLKSIFDTTIYWAVVELPRYKREWEQLSTTDPKLAERVKPFLDHLLDWDGRGSMESTQATLLMAWYEELYGFGYPAEQLKSQFVGNYPEQFKALITAAQKIEASFGNWKMAWGDVNRLQRHANVGDLFQIPFSDNLPSIPVGGMHGPPGVAFTMYFTPSVNLPPLRVMKKHYAVVGTSYLCAVEFSQPVKSRSILQYGASGDPKSPHFFDQAELLSKMQPKSTLFHWDEVEAGCPRKYHPGEAATAAK